LIFLNDFDILILKIKFKKYYINIFSNKKYFLKNHYHNLILPILMMTQSVVAKQLSFIFSTICEETRTNPLSERDRGGE